MNFLQNLKIHLLSQHFKLKCQFQWYIEHYLGLFLGNLTLVFNIFYFSSMVDGCIKLKDIKKGSMEIER